eukprot:EC121109.1.p2 GENE.EC121109.1~~EC121109.1.p2  ORF type:complete len:145 (+),score=35.57 EC121109.1:60-494(+)
MASTVAFGVHPVPVTSATETKSFFSGSSKISRPPQRTFVAADCCQIKMSKKDLSEPGDYVNFFWALAAIDEVERRAASAQVKTKQAPQDSIDFADVISMGHFFEDPTIEPIEEYVKLTYSVKHGFCVSESAPDSEIYPVIDKDM